MRGILRWPFSRWAAQGGRLSVSVWGDTDRGNVRSNNEDCFLALEGKDSPPGVDALLLVADGMGGHTAGETASRLAVEGTVRAIAESGEDAASLNRSSYSSLLRSLIQKVNKEVHDAAQIPDRHGMGTTCTLAVIRNGEAFLAHVGDSRAYLLSNGELKQITTDHSWVEEAVSQGMLTRDEARTHANRNVITRAVGLEPETEVDSFVVSLAKDDLLLLCSDGLNSMIPDDEIGRILKGNDLSQVGQDLIAAANSQGGQDNITVVLARVAPVQEHGNVAPGDQNTDEVNANLETQEMNAYTHLLCADAKFPYKRSW